MKFPLRTAALFFAVAAAIIVSFVLWGDSIDSQFRAALDLVRSRPLAAAAILFATLASDVLLPIPSSFAATACGMFLHPAAGFAVAFFAMNASCAAGYAIGRLCRRRAARIVGPNEMQALEKLQSRCGPWLLLALRPVPVLAETSLVFAGMANLPVKTAVLQCALGNAVLSLVYVLAGACAAAGPLATILVFAATILLSALILLKTR